MLVNMKLDEVQLFLRLTTGCSVYMLNLSLTVCLTCMNLSACKLQTLSPGIYTNTPCIAVFQAQQKF